MPVCVYVVTVAACSVIVENEACLFESISVFSELHCGAVNEGTQSNELYYLCQLCHFLHVNMEALLTQPFSTVLSNATYSSMYC